ncbi:MAG: hypothetical protein GQ564_08715 [Bacteroidales bacterium]|nr:hypothetical protein [Bacteroidales bacterium]
MKVLKRILLIVWVLITLGLIVYSQMMKTEAIRQEMVTREYKKMNKVMSATLDIDSLIKESIFLRNYEKIANKNN